MNLNKFTKLWYLLLFVPFLFTSSCKKEEPAAGPVASFQFEVDDTNFLLVTFSNFSQNANSYSWDFGDANTSTEESPTHEYETAGTYTVTLTATASDGTTSVKSQEVTLSDPDQQLTLLAGNVSKTWKLIREGASLGIGPDAANWTQWFNLQNDGSRNCLYDDEFIFYRDGTFAYDDNGTFWGEGDVYNGTDKADLAESCFDATTENLTVNGNDYSAWLSSDNYSYTFDATNNKITLIGTGAWMGLIKLGTDGYVTTPQESQGFNVVLADGGDSGVDTLDVIFDYTSLGNYWKARYVSYENAADEPELVGPQPKPSFTVSVDNATKLATFTNTSNECDSYSWDFGDGGTSTDENPTHTYAEVGVYSVKLTGTNTNGTVDFTQDVYVGISDPTAADLHGGSSKTWTLKPVAGAFRVGPSIGSGDWFASSVDDVTNRACQFDDEFIFHSDGTFDYDSKGQIYEDGYTGMDPLGCHPDADLAGIFTAFASSTGYTFSLTEATETDKAKITVNGEGAFLGFSKGYNGGEISSSDTSLPQSVTYVVNLYFDEGSSQTLEVSVDISANQDGTAWWTMDLVAQ